MRVAMTPNYLSLLYGKFPHHNKRHPQEMGSKEIEEFLTHLAVELNVAASTQN
jgi:Phage integrase, N-terminal SAM-like domain